MSSRERARRRRAGAGFTLPEVMAASLSASVLAIAAGSVLYFSYAALRRNNERIMLQRDATLVHDMISRVVQAAAPSEVILAPGSVTFATNWGRATRVRFMKSGSNRFITRTPTADRRRRASPAG